MGRACIHTFSRSVKLRAARAAENLLDVKHAEILEPAPLGIVDLRSLDHHRVCREVDTPRQRSRTHEDLRGRQRIFVICIQRSQCVRCKCESANAACEWGKNDWARLDDAFGEHLLRKRTVWAEHPGVVAAKTSRRKLAQLRVAALLGLQVHDFECALLESLLQHSTTFVDKAC